MGSGSSEYLIDVHCSPLSTQGANILQLAQHFGLTERMHYSNRPPRYFRSLNIESKLVRPDTSVARTRVYVWSGTLKHKLLEFMLVQPDYELVLEELIDHGVLPQGSTFTPYEISRFQRMRGRPARK